MQTSLTSLITYLQNHTKQMAKYRYIEPLYHQTKNKYPYIYFPITYKNKTYLCSINSNTTIKAAKLFAKYLEANLHNSSNIFIPQKLSAYTKITLKDKHIPSLYIQLHSQILQPLNKNSKPQTKKQLPKQSVEDYLNKGGSIEYC